MSVDGICVWVSVLGTDRSFKSDVIPRDATYVTDITIVRSVLIMAQKYERLLKGFNRVLGRM